MQVQSCGAAGAAGAGRALTPVTSCQAFTASAAALCVLNQGCSLELRKAESLRVDLLLLRAVGRPPLSSEHSGKSWFNQLNPLAEKPSMTSSI